MRSAKIIPSTGDPVLNIESWPDRLERLQSSVFPSSEHTPPPEFAIYLVGFANPGISGLVGLDEQSDVC